tara:strand:+ start:74 stop:259 length:186 start_codon:yes stop_codon:yes gene_type:complete
MLKEGGTVALEGTTKLDSDIDLSLNESGGAGISLSLRIVYEGLSVTSVTATQVRAIVLGDS